jgi:hypothetical protein
MVLPATTRSPTSAERQPACPRHSAGGLRAADHVGAALALRVGAAGQGQAAAGGQVPELANHRGGAQVEGRAQEPRPGGGRADGQELPAAGGGLAAGGDHHAAVPGAQRPGQLAHETELRDQPGQLPAARGQQPVQVAALVLERRRGHGQLGLEDQRFEVVALGRSGRNDALSVDARGDRDLHGQIGRDSHLTGQAPAGGKLLAVEGPGAGFAGRHRSGDDEHGALGAAAAAAAGRVHDHPGALHGGDQRVAGGNLDADSVGFDADGGHQAPAL